MGRGVSRFECSSALRYSVIEASRDQATCSKKWALATGSIGPSPRVRYLHAALPDAAMGLSIGVWTRMTRWFGALVMVSAHALPARLRHILQVTSWSAPSMPPLLRGAVVAISYFVFAKGSLTLASLHPSASPVWPPSGLALASLLLWGNGLWPAIAAGAFLANVTTLGSLLRVLTDSGRQHA